MSERIHDDEPDVSEPIVRSLLEAECPQWSNAPLEYLKTSGTDNAMWRVRLAPDADVVVRLPRRPGAAAGVAQETAVLRHIERARIRSIVTTPTVRHAGRPHDVFPHPWSVLEWIDGVDAWTSRDELGRRSLHELAEDLAQVVTALPETDEIPGIELQRRSSGARGGPLGPLLERLEAWLTNPEWHAEHLVDVDAVRRAAAEAAEVIEEPVTHGFLHGDLIPGNLLVRNARLRAIIDWGGVGIGDTAQDLAPAWAVLTEAEQSTFRQATGVDDAAWLRGRTFELEHAVGGVLYYVPRKHPLGDVMLRTLDRILSTSG